MIILAFIKNNTAVVNQKKSEQFQSPFIISSFAIIESYLKPQEEIPAKEKGKLLEFYPKSDNEFDNKADNKENVAKAAYQEKLGGRVFDVPYSSFFQPHPEAFDLLIAWYHKELSVFLENPSRPYKLLDLYSGMGVLSALLIKEYPKSFESVVAYDSNPAAIIQAKEVFVKLMKECNINIRTDFF